MAGVKKAAGKVKPDGTAGRGAAKKAKTGRRKPPVMILDPFTGKHFELILRELPGKGKVDPERIRAAVIKVRDERLARERAAEAGPSPE